MCTVSLGHSRSLINGKSQRCQLGHVISCVQSQLITWDIYTDHQGIDDQCALMISVAPAVPPVRVHQCLVSVLISASCQCPSVPHISAHLSCLSVSPISPSQCHLSMTISDTYQCCQSVPPISTLLISAIFQCPSLMPVNAHQCHLPVPPHQ
ncbi:unnamed protein product, partial [Staurois parvus]